MEFLGFKKGMQAHIQEKMYEQHERLFVMDVDRDAMYEEYLNSFPPGSNEVFRKRREFDCSGCRNFIKNFGSVVAIKDGNITTVWDFQTGDPVYDVVTARMSEYIRDKNIAGVWISKIQSIGIDKNFEQDAEGHTTTWEHLHTVLPPKFVHRGSESSESISGGLRDIRNVFRRSLEEITPEAVEIVLELMASNTLYRGEEWRHVVEKFRDYQTEYRGLKTEREKEIWAWEQSIIAGPVVGKIRNHSIGVLLVNLSEGMDVDPAVRKYESVVAPSNYKRPQAIFTQKMLEDAKKSLESEGLMDSLGRRYANLDDITLNNILFANRDVVKRMVSADVFAELAASAPKNPKKFDGVEELPLEVFLHDVLPTVTSMEVFLENRHGGNMVSLIAPKVAGSRSLFKWDNGFSWAYAGNITYSMKERVKAAGGNVSGVLRFSIQWNEDGDNNNDFDAHCKEPDGHEIYYGTRRMNIKSGGSLDVDIIEPRQQINNGVAVENITWPSADRMPEGMYRFFVYNYNHRGGHNGFRAEIEFGGQIYSFSCDRDIRQHETVQVADVVYSRAEGFRLIPHLQESVTSRNIWGLQTQEFHPVLAAMYSPNYWDQQQGTGNRHLFFMLRGCVNPENPNGFFNEFVREEFSRHKRVFEALGSKMRCADDENQLSGVGFSTTQRNTVVLRIEGAVQRIVKVRF